MREYELIIDEAFRIGLVPIDGFTMNAQVLYECLGFRVGPAGLEGYKHLDNVLPSTLDIHYSWPFPQYVKGERYNVLVVRDNLIHHEDIVYAISDDHSTVEHISTIDQLHYGQGTMMEVVDFGEYLFMTNGVAMVYWDPDLVAWQTVASLPTVPMMRTICNLKGQAIGGNIVSVWGDCDETFIVWSKIGEFNFTPDQTNEAGYRRDPYGGTILATRRLGHRVVVYSSKGITFMIPVEETTSFNFIEASNIGMVNQGAVDGSFERQIFVGSDYVLREVTNEGIKPLGYKRFMEQLKDGQIIVRYEPSEENFYISNGEKTFMLSPYGLSEIRQHPSAVWKGGMLPDTVDERTPYFITGPFDFGYRGLKTIFTMELDAIGVDEVSGSTSWAHNMNTWGDTVYRSSNNMGIVSTTVSGNIFDFRFRFGIVSESTIISRLKVRYKMTDLRGIRGVKAPPPRGQSYAD